MRVIFFGAGKRACEIYREIAGNPQIFTDEYLAFADNNADLWGSVFNGCQVISPADICKYKVDAVLITSMYVDAIHKQLLNELGMRREQIFRYDEYCRKCHAEWVYRKRYKGPGPKAPGDSACAGPIVVYTAITGNYDELKEPLFVGDNITYVCMTDDPHLKSKIWNIEYIKHDFRDNVHLARHIKMNPHSYFPDYEFSVWVDGKYQILDDLRKYVSLYLKENNILCFPHPERECICDEVAACIVRQVGNKKDMLLQVSEYLKRGYPVDNGLYETGCMVRIHNDSQVKALMKEWEEELLKYSIRDQLSFPYVCWKNGYIPDICGLDVNRNPWLLMTHHNI